MPRYFRICAQALCFGSFFLVPAGAVAGDSCRRAESSFAPDIERFLIEEGLEAAGAVREKVSAGSHCTSEFRLSSADRKILREIQRELAGLPEAASRSQAAAIVSKYEGRISARALTAILASSEKRKFESVVAALRGSPAFSSAYVRFEGAVAAYHRQAREMFCGIDCRERALKEVEAAKEILFAELVRTTLPAPLQRDLKLGLFSVLRRTYEENSRRALESARRAGIGLSVAQAVKGEILATGWFAIAMLTMGRSLGLATAELGATASSMEAVLMNAALSSLSRTAAGAATGAAAAGGARVAGVVSRALARELPGESFFCKVAAELRAQGPMIARDALVGAALGGVIGSMIGGKRFSKTAQKAASGAGSEVSAHLASRARMLGKNESILPSAAAALAAHAVAGGALVLATQGKQQPRTREVIEVDLATMNLPEAEGKSLRKPGSLKRAGPVTTKKVTIASEMPKTRTKPAPVATPDGPSTTSRPKEKAAPPVVPLVMIDTSVSPGPAGEGGVGRGVDPGPKPGNGLFRADARSGGHGAGKESGSGGLANLFPGTSTLRRLENDYRRRYEERVVRGDAHFLDADDLQLGSFQRRVISSLYEIWKYPPEALKSGATGVTPVEITFDRGGKVVGASVLESSGTSTLDEEALRAVQALGPVGALPRSYQKDEYRLILLFEYGVKSGSYKGQLR